MFVASVPGGHMSEWIPIVAGCCLSGPVLLWREGKVRATVSMAAIVLATLMTTIASGEYRASWFYVIADLAEVSVGFGAGLVLSGLISRSFPRREKL